MDAAGTDLSQLKPIVEALLMGSDEPLSIDRLIKLLDERQPTRETLSAAIAALKTDYEGRGIELAEMASGFRFRVRADHARLVSRLWEERKPRYSRAFLETLAIIAYRQPVTRGEIEHIRGVAVSSNIIRQLLERKWIKVVGHRDVPGRPAVFATTREFLDYFGLKSLDGLPSLAELKDIDDINADLFAIADTDGVLAESDARAQSSEPDSAPESAGADTAVPESAEPDMTAATPSV